jgi:digeranylgeranylglycerophospholipid reductase
MQDFDLIVIGGGPAGSRTAARVAGKGYRVLLLEKRERIGYPVRCAEAVGPRDVIERYLALDDDLISSSVDGVLVVSPDGTRFELQMSGIGFTVDRELFDRRLADAAVDAGAELRTGHQAVGLLGEPGRVTGVAVKDLGSGGTYEVSSAVVAGADGVEALSTRWAGLASHFRPEEVFSCAQELITGIEKNDTAIEFHLGRTYAPGGYAWVFPKGDRMANVGVGINSRIAGSMTASDYLDAFLEHRCPGAERTRLVIGGCSVARGIPALATGGYVAVGEAARHNNPFSGGGIVNALEAADMASDAVVTALGRGDASPKMLRPYSKAWRGSVGKTNEAFFHAARIFYAMSDCELDVTCRKLSRVSGIFDEKGIKPARMIAALIRANPLLLLKFLGSFIGARRGS